MFISDQNMIKAFGILKESGVVKFYVEIYEILGVDKSWVHRIKNQEKNTINYPINSREKQKNKDSTHLFVIGCLLKLACCWGDWRPTAGR